MIEDFKAFIYNKSLDFSIKITKLYSFLNEEKKEHIISKQILRSGTSIGANLAEAQYGISKKDFLSKIYISLKETAETMYWLEVLHRAGHLSQEQFNSIFSDCEELKKIFMSITKTSKQSLTPNS
ncbi:MAG: four helix bundle protein [Bacteroidaceae bacterium]|nr:four helix bundle protein [Bacteroidaceae bacterium]